MRLLTTFLTLTLPLLTAAYRGDMTHYDPGLGSCGAQSSSSDDIVALSKLLMDNPANPNANTKCFSHIHIRAVDGSVVDATVVDTCEACATEDIDASTGLFYKVAPHGDGLVGGVEWWF
ncbi:hypothetical protein ACLMJK_005002 [Lecanora helva]